MSVGFGDDFKEQVRAATDLVGLVSEVVSLTPVRNGSDYVGLCPSPDHNDKNPSFHVYPDRQTYRCWSCQFGGDCFTWVQEMQRVSFPEALELLAQRANIEIPNRARSEFAKKSADSKVTQYEVVEWAVNLMQQALRTGEAGELAREYLHTRNLSDETIRTFRLGYHPENWSWLLDKARGRFSEKQLLNVGLVGERKDGHGYYDNLVGRLVFPIINERGQPVAFGGRVLPGSNIESPAKYWNSPESHIFLKRRSLYAFDQSRKAILNSKSVIVVEGYMDCIACHQAGIANVVATLGTALTEDHVKFVKRFADRAILMYDGDEAGRKAAEGSIGRFLAQDLDLRILTLSDGQDPADYLENHGTEQFQSLIDSAPEAWEYKLLTVRERYGLDTISGRQDVMREMLEFLAAAPGLQGSVREDLIVKSVCQRVRADEATVRRQLQETRRKKSTTRIVRHDRGAGSPVVNSRQTGADLAEQELLGIILICPQYTDYIRHRIGPDDFQNDRRRRLLELCFDLVAEEGLLPDAQRVIAAAESDSDLLNLVNDLLDAASEKGISDLMNELPLAPEEGDGTFVPPHLERVLEPVLQRRAKNNYMLSKQQPAQADPSTSELNSDTVDALRRVFQLRQKQMGNEPPTLK